ncbi:MAG TPA: hypothetical protein VEC02_02660 [Nitrososphaerales archaeon]|nr:hypothetical protein [Nitrososphaerales archaeon]
MVGVDLTEEDLEVAEASVRFAMENCPVEGLLSKEDGTPVTFDDLQALLDQLNEIEGQRAPSVNLSEDLASQLRNIVDYTSENCPVEGVTSLHDGRPVSGKNVTTLAEKLRLRGQA